MMMMVCVLLSAILVTRVILAAACQKSFNMNVGLCLTENVSDYCVFFSEHVDFEL